MKKMYLLYVFIVFSCSQMLFAVGQKDEDGETKEKVELEILLVNQEMQAQTAEVIDLYVEENPHVSYKFLLINEGQEERILTRVAAGNPPHITDRLPYPLINRNNYKTFANLLEIDYPYWGQLDYDAKELTEKSFGIEDYVPSVISVGTFNFTFIYHQDIMEKIGVEPHQVRTWVDLDNLLIKIKEYADNDPDINYGLDLGWHLWVWSQNILPNWAVSLGATYEDIEDLWMGDIDWTDLDNNPYVPVFRKLKEYYDKGIIPEDSYKRKWHDMENSFISKKSIMLYHGPWPWGKTLAQNPDANLEGMILPPGKDGLIAAYPVDASNGDAIYAAHVDSPDWEEIKKFFNWFTSPEVAALRSQYMGQAANFKLEALSPDYVFNHPQNIKVVRPSKEGAFGDITWSKAPMGWGLVGRYKVEGTADPLHDDALSAYWGKYFNEEITLTEFLEVIKTRWQTAYDI